MKRPILFFLLLWGSFTCISAQDNARAMLTSADDSYLNNAISKSYRIRTVVIDPGHGGKDSGCLGKNSLEKDIALSISKDVAEKINAAYPDIRVILTRDKDVFIPLHERADIANKNNADLFISVHCNAIENANHIRGSETYVMGLHTAEENLEVAKRENSAILLEEDFKTQYGGYDPNSPEGHIFMEFYQTTHLEYSLLIADKIEKHMGKAGIHKSRGVRQAGFLVLRATAMPSVLVESGYLTNDHDHDFLNTDSGQSHVSDAIYKAFRDYKKEVEGEENSYLLDPIADTQVKTSEQPEVIPVNVPSGKREESTKTTGKKEPSATAIKESVSYKIQIGAYGEKKDLTKAPWKNLSSLEILQENNIYKYLVSGFVTIEEARKAKMDLRADGFAGAFLVAYKGKDRISIQEALEIDRRAQN